MPEFLAETYAPRGAASVPGAAALARAARHASGPGAPVRFLGAIAIPEEETCFYLYQAPTADAAHAALTAAGVRPDRITRAVPLWPPAPAPGPPGTCAGRPHRPSRPAPEPP